MAMVGYARVSTIDQDLTLQKQSLTAAGCDKIFSEKQSATKTGGRKQLEACLDYLREGDILIVTRIDRLSRSLRDLQNLVHDLSENGIFLKTVEQPIDTSSAAGKAFFDMLGVFAEFETNLRRERQLEGVAKAKKDGKYKGRQPTARAKSIEVINLIKEGLTREAVAKKLDIGIASVYRILKKYQENNPSSPLPGSRSKIKIAVLDVRLYIENNSKFVRGKKKVRDDIEYEWSKYYDAQKLHPEGYDYLLKVPYESLEELDSTIEDIIGEAHSAADLRHCYSEINITHKETGKDWS
ncbi:DNA invertase [Oleiphilus sp. HI0043]|uniref:recombinase family protein n=2 Tax=unclassified Oleiphilus TaxID=2631174 RepID=UPI0007C279A5|nr:recombinase family protein [Oleiphilus sp. HI0043]KZY34791.1 DNA invertase [Oleiphilus sp. HI0043]KZZ67348.1 DNA invertase [Oleiphilus sp. HI0128]